MAQIFNGQRVRGVRVLDEGATLFNMMQVRGVRVADDGVAFDGGQQTIGVDVLDQDRAIWNEQLVMGVVVIADDRPLYNGMEILPASALTGSLGGDTSAQRVIVLTDYAGDCDDAAALAVACDAHRKGHINLLGVVVSSSIATSAPGVYGQLAAYGLQNAIPVYAYQGNVGSYNNLISAAVRDRFGVAGQMRTAYPDDLTGLRTLLANAPDGSVKIIDVGAPVSGARLMDSPADAISPLTGMQLIAAKVSALYQMAGRFDGTTTTEYNATRDIASTRRVYEDWPTTVYAHGWEVGNPVFCGPPVFNIAGADPVGVAYVAYNIRMQRSWDPLTVRHAVYGERDEFGFATANGRIAVDAAGLTTASTATPGNRFVMSKLVSDAELGTRLNDVLAEMDISPRQNVGLSRFTFPFTEETGTTFAGTGGAQARAMVAAIPRTTAPLALDFGGNVSGRREWGIIDKSAPQQPFPLLVGVVARAQATSAGIMLGRIGFSGKDNFFLFRGVGSGVLDFLVYRADGTNSRITGANNSVLIGEYALYVGFATPTSGLIRRNGVQLQSATLPSVNQRETPHVPYRFGSGMFNSVVTDYFTGQIAAAAIRENATVDDIAAFETDLRTIATAKGITLP